MRFNRTCLTICALTALLSRGSDAQIGSIEFTVYPCRYKSVDEIANLLRPLLPGTETAQLIVDGNRNRILLSGDSRVQRIAQRVLAESDRPERLRRLPAVEQPSLPTVSRSQPASDVESVTRFIHVRPDHVEHLNRQLSALFANQMNVQRVGSREVLLIGLGQPSPTQIAIEFDEMRSGVLIGGPTRAVDQFVTLIRAMASGDNGTRVLRVRRQNHQSVHEIIEPPATSESKRPMGRTTPQNESGQIAPARYLLQDDVPESGRSAESGMPPDRPSDAALRQFEGVEIESLPDLDVIILRGREHDLEQLTEIIQQLERISQETQPEVLIVHLRHAQCEAVAEMVSQSAEELVRGRAGKMKVTPLVKPNALLVIGWGDALAAVMTLIQKLDQPVAADTQSVVFRLRFAAASAVRETLNGFFSDRGGLGPRIQVTIDERTNSIVVYAAPRDVQEVGRIIQDLDRPDSAAVNRARIFPIQNALAADVAETLQQAIRAGAGSDRSAILELQIFDAEGQRILKSGSLEFIQVTPNPRNNTIIVSSPLENLELIAELIRQLDSPAVQAKIKVFQIVNGDAASLVETLRSLLPSQVGVTVEPQLPSDPDETSLAPLRFSVDTRSNSIIATGSEGDLRIVEALLIKLDQSNTMQRKSMVYQLKNSPAVDVATAVNQFLVNRRRVEQAAPGAESPFQELEREVVVVPEPVANKLIIAATPRYFDEISQLIEKLDEQPPQVMIQVLIAEVSLSDTDEFGVELGLQDPVLFDRSLLGDLITTTNTTQNSTPAGIVTTTEQLIRSATNLPGFGFNSVQPLGNSGSTSSLAGANIVGSQGISNFDVGRGNEQLGFGGLVLSASSQNVSVLLRALEESRRVDILSRPQIRTLDNQPAFIQVGQRVPRIIGSNVNNNGQSNSITLENVGLILGVTPRISPEGNVVMEIDAEKSSLGPEQDGIPVAVSVDGTIIRSPQIDTTTAQATVSTGDGETIVLGGLITNGTQQFHRQVPFLGDIPLLGRLFRYDGTQTRRTELLIILTPHIIRDATDNERIRQTEVARMSWCAADVFDLQGDIGFYGTSSMGMIESGQPEVVYPDLNPDGEPIPWDGASSPSRIPEL